MILLFLYLFHLFFTFALPEILSFDQWTSFFGSTPNIISETKTLQHRKASFARNIAIIREHNSKNLSWRLGVNQFADLNVSEFMQAIGSRQNSTSNVGSRKKNSWKSPPTTGKNPKSLDWRDEGAVTEVKNERSCGACWAFAATGAVEGALFVDTGKLISLSEQQLINCAPGGCNGGSTTQAYTYMENHGVTTERNYTYVSKSGSCAITNKTDPVVYLSSYVDIPSMDKNAMEDALQNGPVSVYLDPDIASFQLYKSGVYNDVDCPIQPSHAVLNVGYGVSNSGDKYWIIKNQWSAHWGMDGYILLKRKKGAGTCGVQMYGSQPYIGDAPVVQPTRVPTFPPIEYYDFPQDEKFCDGDNIALYKDWNEDGCMCVPVCRSGSSCPAVPDGIDATAGCFEYNTEASLCGLRCDGGKSCGRGTVPMTLAALDDTCLCLYPTIQNKMDTH